MKLTWYHGHKMLAKIPYYYFTLVLMVFGLGGCASLGMSTQDGLTEQERAVQKINTLIEKSIIVLEEITQSPDNSIPAALLTASEALVIIPNMVKVGFGVGANLGKGIAMIRQDDRTWSNPVVVKMGGGSFGLQIGAQATDIILVLRNRNGVENLLESQMTLGADLGIAAGPVGVATEAGTNLKFDSEIYSYSRSKGLFAGVSLKGQVIEIDKPSNLNLYEKVVSAADIFMNRVTTSANVVKQLKRKLHELAP